MSPPRPSQLVSRPTLPVLQQPSPQLKSTAPPRRTVTVWIGNASFQAVVV